MVSGMLLSTNSLTIRRLPALGLKRFAAMQIKVSRMGGAPCHRRQDECAPKRGLKMTAMKKGV